MEPLNLFPTRIEIGQFTGADRKSVKVYASPEFNRALSAVFVRIGGAFGLDTGSLETLASFAAVGAESLASNPEPPSVANAGAEVASLREQLAGVTAQLEGSLAAMAPLIARIEALELQQPVSPTSVATSLGHPGTYPANATDLATVITLANAIKANNLAKNV